jgi:hypothetical protein
MSELRIIPPSWEVRGVDAFGSGAFLARRARYTAGTVYEHTKVGDQPEDPFKHKGVDFVVRAGDMIACPCRAWIVKYGYAYSDEMTNARLSEGQILRSIRLEWDEEPEWRIKYLYARLIYQGGLPFRVDAGVPFAEAQDLTLRYPEITNHVHVEIRHRGVLVDPMTVLMEQA